MNTFLASGSGLLLALALIACPNDTPDFNLSLSSTTLSVKPDSSANLTVTLNRIHGFADDVSLSVEGLPNGVTASFNPATTSGTNSVLSLSVTKTAKVGTLPLTVKGSSMNLTRTANLEFAVSSPQIPLPPSTFAVDPALKPSAPALLGLEDSQPRPLSRLADAHGTTADFVSNELILTTDDPDAVSAFLARWQGTLIKTLNPSSGGLDGLKPMYLVRLNAGSADGSKLASDVAWLEPNSRNDLRLSDQAGLNLLAAAAREAAGGLSVGMNWVAEGSGLDDSSTLEAPNGPDSSYKPNAFDWYYLNAPGAYHIGATEAWRGLSYANKLGNKIKIAVLDGGFAPQADFPGGWEAASIGNQPPTGARNRMGCGGNPCPWHGTHVAESAAGAVDNGFGTAGTGGPVANLLTIDTPGDMATSIAALALARIKGARIINMSYGSRVVATLFWTVLPFNAATLAVRHSGALLFAAAGNNGEDVDAEDCFGVCWERVWHTPCENGGVICVGGLNTPGAFQDPLMPHPNSNYGDKDVDIFAPFRVYGGPDPDNPSNAVRWINGTSFASPYVAGVAALVWAANPNQSADQVENVLMSTAKPGHGHAQRYVNALGAVQRVVGNIPPRIQIATPGPNSSFNLYQGKVDFEAKVSDFEDGSGCCAVVWTSNVDGSLGSGALASFSFNSPGVRTVTATATDSQGATAQARVTIDLTVSGPNVKITNPTANQTLFRGVDYSLVGRAGAGLTDLCTPGSGAGTTWSSTVSSDAITDTSKCSTKVRFDTSGSRTLTLNVRDRYGAVGQDSVSVNVSDPPPLVVTISLPHNGDTFIQAQKLTLSANLGVQGGGSRGTAPYQHRWIWRAPNCADFVIQTKAPSNTPVPVPDVYEVWDANTDFPPCDGAGSLTIEVTDANNLTATDSRSIRVVRPPR